MGANGTSRPRPAQVTWLRALATLSEEGPDKQVDRLRDGEADRPSRRERELSYPRGYSLKRIALDLDAPPLETGTFGDADVRPEDLQEVLAKAPTPSSGSGAGSLHAGSSQGLEWVGKVGEQLAARSLEQQGFEVCWVNENGELGLPFDLSGGQPAHTPQRWRIGPGRTGG
ncbi:unnamed protein product [Symbiodinium sp. CCMP2456]|nr:unnamed protein product [Symbiodinium sp. CCMP2456]